MEKTVHQRQPSQLVYLTSGPCGQPVGCHLYLWLIKLIPEMQLTHNKHRRLHVGERQLQIGKGRLFLKAKYSKP